MRTLRSNMTCHANLSPRLQTSLTLAYRQQALVFDLELKIDEAHRFTFTTELNVADVLRAIQKATANMRLPN